jgi:hypothetical protein
MKIYPNELCFFSPTLENGAFDGTSLCDAMLL